MRLSYETATATIIQFIVIAVLNIADALQSVIPTCIHSGNECVSNLLSSVIYYILIIICYGAILAVGISAQEKRSKRLGQLLIIFEAIVFVVAAYGIKLDLTNHNAVLSLVTDVANVVLALWVGRLAIALVMSDGRRVVRRRPRQRHSPNKEL